ncbi:19541_t:CDS:2 [Funneliformis geosporum]|nr:19541_t:CDS:2 [Funneliformis geosporum]
MTSVKLNWLIYGEDPYEKVSQVDIDTSERVIALKKAIKKDISESVSARDLKVFKVDISLGEARNEDAVLMCKTDLSIIGQEMNNNLQKIGVYFNVQPVETNLHIFVQLPTVVTVPLGMCRKIEDEKLMNFWKVLKDTIFTLNKKFFRLPGDAHFFGNDKEPSILYIRKCYNDLNDTVFNNNVKNLRISGNPGIGKTFYGYYLLYHLALLYKTVIYDTHTKTGQVILFEQEKAFYLHRTLHAYEITRYLNDPNVWYIVDGKKCDKVEAKTILICSDHYKDFDKLSPHIRYMPVWSWKEIDTCRNKIYNSLSSDDVRKLYNKWGGIPRYVLENTHNMEIQDQLQEAIDSCSEKIFKYIGGAESKKDISHKLIHIWTNIPDEDIMGETENIVSDEDDEVKREPYTKKIILFASNYVGRQVTKKLKTSILNKLFTELEESLSSGKSNQFLGSCFEQIAHQRLQNGRAFDIRSLEPNGRTNSTKSFEKQDEILTFSEIKDIENNMYYRPESKIFPSIDAICAPDSLFQMTTSLNHPIKIVGLQKISGKLASDGEIPFYFVVPSQLYDIYKKQNFATINNAIAKNVPPWISNRIKQYALRLDLSSGGLRRMTYTALIEEQLSNLSIFGEPSTATTTDDVEISSGLSIPAKRPLLDRSFLDRTCKKKRGGQ